MLSIKQTANVHLKMLDFSSHRQYSLVHYLKHAQAPAQSHCVVITTIVSKQETSQAEAARSIQKLFPVFRQPGSDAWITFCSIKFQNLQCLKFEFEWFFATTLALIIDTYYRFISATFKFASTTSIGCT